jgi:hypothetical protein
MNYVLRLASNLNPDASQVARITVMRCALLAKKIIS